MRCASTLKGQVATEYLIILAVVVIISLIVVGVLQSFAGIRTGFEVAKSKIEWQSKEIVLSAQTVKTDGSAVLLLINNANYPVQVFKAGIGKEVSDQANPVTLQVGEVKAIRLIPGTAPAGKAGDEYTYEVTLKYRHATEQELVSTVTGTISGVYEQ